MGKIESGFLGVIGEPRGDCSRLTDQAQRKQDFACMVEVWAKANWRRFCSADRRERVLRVTTVDSLIAMIKLPYRN